jgi:hypothetical protein
MLKISPKEFKEQNLVKENRTSFRIVTTILFVINTQSSNLINYSETCVEAAPILGMFTKCLLFCNSTNKIMHMKHAPSQTSLELKVFGLFPLGCFNHNYTKYVVIIKYKASKMETFFFCCMDKHSSLENSNSVANV